MKKDATDTRLLSELRRHNPHKVRVYSSDDEYRDIAVPTRRRRWAAVISAIEAKAWTKAELLNKAGEVLGYVDNVGGAHDVEDLSPSFEGVRGQLLLGERIAALCMRSVKEAISSRDDEMKALLSAQGEVVREMATAVKSLGEVYRDVTAAEQDAADVRIDAATEAAAAAANGGEIRQLLEALPMLLQALPVLRSLASGAPAAAPDVPRVPNGKG